MPYLVSCAFFSFRPGLAPRWWPCACCHAADMKRQKKRNLLLRRRGMRDGTRGFRNPTRRPCPGTLEFNSQPAPRRRWERGQSERRLATGGGCTSGERDQKGGCETQLYGWVEMGNREGVCFVKRKGQPVGRKEEGGRWEEEGKKEKKRRARHPTERHHRYVPRSFPFALVPQLRLRFFRRSILW